MYPFPFKKDKLISNLDIMVSDIPLGVDLMVLAWIIGKWVWQHYPMVAINVHGIEGSWRMRSRLLFISSHLDVSICVISNL